MKKVWLFVILAFVLLIAAWSFLITLAVKNQPEKIEVNPGTPAEQSH